MRNFRFVTTGLVVVIFNLLQFYSFAQCPTSININSVSTTQASCPSAGSAVINSNAGSNAVYQLISGPVTGGYQTTAQVSNTFTSLPAGDYTVEVRCNPGSGVATADFTITSNYTPIVMSAAVSDVCGNYQTGGTITVSASGGSGTLLYGILKSDNANAPDADFAYGNANIFNLTEFGNIS